jgi:drug/metabolite transporter (DMT)-like permease
MYNAKVRATLVGFSAILMWALLGVFTGGSGKVPPFLLTGLCFGLSGLVATLGLAVTRRLGALRQPLRVYAIGTAGLFGYHALYFTALRNAPLIEAGLINYLWPLLIVLFSGLLPGERLAPHHVVGVVLGFVGAALLVVSGGALSLSSGYAFGYGAAFLAAFTWSGYSVISRRLAGVPTETVAGFCLATAVLSLACHFAFETTVWPADWLQWTFVALLAALPLGLAFFVWDYGVKHGDIQIIGAASYATPVLSTGLLALSGYGRLGLASGLACLFVTVGALVAARDMLRRRAA